MVEIFDTAEDMRKLSKHNKDVNDLSKRIMKHIHFAAEQGSFKIRSVVGNDVSTDTVDCILKKFSELGFNIEYKDRTFYIDWITEKTEECPKSTDLSECKHCGCKEIYTRPFNMYGIPGYKIHCPHCGLDYFVTNKDIFHSFTGR